MTQRPVLVLRPEPGASASVQRAISAGLNARAYPLFAVRPVAWDPPDPAAFDAVLLTSANAARHGGPALASYHALPTFAVGQATAAGAKAAGFLHVEAGATDVQEVLDHMKGAGLRRVFHPAGRDVREADSGLLTIRRATVYASEECGDADGLGADLAEDSLLLVHSPRAGRRLAALVAPEVRARHVVAAISPAAMSSAGTGWAALHAAELPDDTALLALAAKLCQ